MYSNGSEQEIDFKYFYLVVFAIYIVTLFTEIKIILFNENFDYYASFMGVLTVILFLYHYESSIFKGRTNAIDFLIWIFIFFVSALLLYLFTVAVIVILDSIDPIYDTIHNKDVIERRQSIPIYFLSSFVAYHLYQLIKFYVRRFQDLNISGLYFLLSLIPLVNFYIGYKIFFNNKKLIGILVFLSFVLSYIVIPFIPGDSGSNYYAFNPHFIREFKRKKRLIAKSKLLSEEQRMRMIEDLIKYYSDIEELHMHAFIEEQVNELTNKEISLINVALQNRILDEEMVNLTMKIKENSVQLVKEMFDSRYSMTNWEKL
jgi:uncharacterized membrane protein YhaH (DUF805 family)